MTLPYAKGPERVSRAMRSFWIAGLLLILALSFSPSPPSSAAAAPESPQSPRRVLVIYSGSRLLPSNLLFDESLRAALALQAGPPIEISSEFMDEVRFPARYRERTRNLLQDKYGDRPAGVILAYTTPSLEFCLLNRDGLFRGIPIIFAGLDRDSTGGPSLPPGVTGVRSSFDAAATLRLALRLHPRTQQVFVIPSETAPDTAGGSPDRASLRELDLPLPLHRLTPQPLPQLLQELAGLPENSLVLDLSGSGNRGDPLTPPQDAMRRISKASPAPVYGIFDPLVGSGLVGAVTTPIDASARAAASLLLDILSLDPGNPLPAAQDLIAFPLFDWRELRRWELRKSQLPPGSIVRFEPRSFWRQHLALVITTGVLFLLQSGLILSLVLQSRRRQRAELEVRRRREELAHMTRVATMGELTASLAHEINQPLAAILSNAQAAQRLLSTGGEHREEIQEILSDIAADDQRAGEVIRRMRDLLRKGESHPSPIDLNGLVDEVVGIVHGEMILQNVSLELELSPRPLRVQGDRVQLQQVLLNLIVNALDAMKESAGGSRRVVVRTQAIDTGRLAEVAVQDSGPGIPTDRIDQIFEPFYTTKTKGLGLGLAICRSIIQSHGGRIGSRNNADRGATFWFTLPAMEERQP